MTAWLWVCAGVGAAAAVYQHPKAARDLAYAIYVIGAALTIPFALLLGHAPPRARRGHHAPPAAPPKRTAGMTLAQTLERLYIDEDVISGAQYAALYGAAFDGHVLGRMLPATADVDAVLDAVTTPQTAQEAFDEGAAQRLRDYEARPYDSFTTHAAAIAQVPPEIIGDGGRYPIGREGDVMQMLSGETIEHAEERAGRRITATHREPGGHYTLAKLGEVIFRAPRPFVDLCDCRGVAGDCGTCTNACRAPGAPRDPTNVERA